MKIEHKDILLLSVQPWDYPTGSNSRQIAHSWSRHNRVLYVNPPINRKSRIVEREDSIMKMQEAVLQGKRPALEAVSEQLWVLTPPLVVESINWLPDGALFSFLNRLNARRLAESVRPFLRQLDFSNFLLFNDSSMFMGPHLREALQPSAYLYYIRDKLTGHPYWRKHGKALEPKTIAEADVVVTNAPVYAKYAKAYTRHAYFVGQGCDLPLFDDEGGKLSVPDCIRQLKGPVLGYTGPLSPSRVDQEALEAIAAARPAWNIVLMGEVKPGFDPDKLQSMPNVSILPPCSPADLPAYLKGFDLCLFPQPLSGSGKDNFPWRIADYLAMGKAVVATRMSTINYFAEYVYLADDSASLLSAAERALAEDTSELHAARRLFAFRHSWDAVTDAIGTALARARPQLFDTAETLKP